MGAIQPEEAKVYIGVIDIAPSALATSSASFDATGYITNFSESGGEEDIESNPVFGGGNIDKIKPRTQLEVSFDIIMQYGTDVTKFDEFKFGPAGSTELSASYTDEILSSGNAPEKQIVIEFTDGTNYYSLAYNNVKAITFEPESAADDFLKGTINFKLSPTDSNAYPNKRIKAAAVSTMGAWYAGA
jgi:hypothetical protein